METGEGRRRAFPHLPSPSPFSHLPSPALPLHYDAFLMQRQNLGEMLVAANLIDEVQMQVALAEQRQSGKRFGSTLVELKFIDENVLAAFLAKQMDVPCISLLRIDIPKRVVRKLTRDVAVSCRAIPVRIDDDGRLEVAMVDPTDIDTLVRKLT